LKHGVLDVLQELFTAGHDGSAEDWKGMFYVLPLATEQ